MLYADGTAIMYSDNNVVDGEYILNKELSVINDWLRLDKLTLNVSKTKCMTFALLRKLANVGNIQLHIDQLPLEKVNVFKYLGI